MFRPIDGALMFFSQTRQERVSLDSEVDSLGLVSGMVGMRVDETRTFALNLPGNYAVEDLRGVACSATIKLRELFSWNLSKVLPCEPKASACRCFSVV